MKASETPTCKLQGLLRCFTLQDTHSVCSCEAVPGSCGVYHLQTATQVSALQRKLYETVSTCIVWDSTLLVICGRKGHIWTLHLVCFEDWLAASVAILVNQQRPICASFYQHAADALT